MLTASSGLPLASISWTLVKPWPRYTYPPPVGLLLMIVRRLRRLHVRVLDVAPRVNAADVAYGRQSLLLSSFFASSYRLFCLLFVGGLQFRRCRRVDDGKYHRPLRTREQPLPIPLASYRHAVQVGEVKNRVALPVLSRLAHPRFHLIGQNS